MNDSGSATKLPRWGLLRGFWIACLGLFLYVRLGGVDEGARTFLSIAALLLGGFLSLIWLLLFSRLPGAVRLKGLGLALGLLLVFKLLVRVKEFEGDTYPVFTWRWTPVKDYTLPPMPLAAATGTPGPVAAALHSTLPEFPQYLGLNRNAVTNVKLAKPAANWQPKELWRQPVGAGWSGFIVAGGKAITQEQRGESELITCYELLTGKPLWAHEEKERFSETMGGDGPRATPVAEKGRVYAQGATGFLTCLELETGKTIWSKNILREAKVENLQWGKSNAPLLAGDLVIVTLGLETQNALAAYKKETGELVWRAGHDKSSYSSPVLGTLAGREQLVNLYADSVAGHDPKTGEELWRYQWPGAPAKCAIPVLLDDDRVLVSSGYGIGSVLLKIKQDDKGVFAWQELWRNLQLKSKFSNLPMRDGFVYALDEGVLACLELKTGRRTWKSERFGYGQVLLADDLLLIQAESGAFIIAETNPREYRELARFTPLQGKTWNTPALAGPYLIVRNAEEAACYELPLRDAK